MTHSSPVFVYGALRSGTTLFRLMLNTHLAVQNPGEVDFLFDFLHPASDHPSGWRYDRAAMTAHRIFRDKDLELPAGLDGLDLLQDMLAQLRARDSEAVLTLNVHRHVARLVEVLPEAKIIHLLRDPRDVARSCVVMGWNGISYYGIDSWLKTERDWDRATPALAALPILDVTFEGLMEDVEGELRRVCTFLDVPFESEILEYHKDTTYGPPNPAMANQWKRKAKTGEIALLEGKCGPMIESRGYQLSDTPPDRPGALRQKGLFVQNRFLRWRHNIRRFGLPLFVGTHLTRLLGLHRAHDVLSNRVEQRVIRNLK
jgi:hypothetical protein